MKIEKVKFHLHSTQLDRINVIADALIKMGVQIPHIATTLTLMTGHSIKNGRLDLFDIGFHAYWFWEEEYRVTMELMQIDQ